MSFDRLGLFRSSGPASLGAALASAALAAALLPLLLLPSCGAEASASTVPRQRTVVLVVADTLRADRLSAYGYPQPTSPALERRARLGTLFERAFTPAPWTLPALASLMTSTWPRDHGAGLHGEDRNLLHQVPEPLSPDGPATLAECLRGASFRTAAIVTNPFFGFGLERGFDEVEASYGINALEVVARGERVLEKWGEEGGFLYLHFMDVHDPLSPDDEDLRALAPERPLPARPQHLRDIHARLHLAGTRAERGWIYDAAIRRIDRALEKLFDYLERSGRLGDAIVIFTADHGEALWEHERIERWHYDRGAAAGMGHGQSLFQELVGVPLIVWAKELEDGRCAMPVSLVDVAPSILEWIDCPVPKHFATRGASLSAARAQRLPPRELVLEGIGMGRERRSIVDARSTKVISGDAGLEPRLAYDLSADPLEGTPLAPSAHTEALFMRIAGPDPLAPRRSTAIEILPAALESMKALGYLSGAEAGLPARGFASAANVRELPATALRELTSERGEDASNGAAREAAQSPFHEAELATLVGLPGAPHAAEQPAFLAVRARPRALLAKSGENELTLRLPPRGDARLGLIASAPVTVDALIDEQPFALPLASSNGALPLTLDPNGAELARELPPIDLAAGAHFFRDPLLGQLRFQWIARGADGDQAERITLRFRSREPLRALATQAAPLPHPSWSLLAATAGGWRAMGAFVDPPLEGEAAVLAGDRVWVAGAGAEDALWLYGFSYGEGQLAARERMRLPLDATTRARSLSAEGSTLRLEVVGAGGRRSFTCDTRAR